jgi:hypothetical protein
MFESCRAHVSTKWCLRASGDVFLETARAARLDLMVGRFLVDGTCMRLLPMLSRDR